MTELRSGRGTENEDSSRKGDVDPDLWEQGGAKSSPEKEEELLSNLTSLLWVKSDGQLALSLSLHLKEQGCHQTSLCQASAGSDTYHHIGLWATKHIIPLRVLLLPTFQSLERMFLIKRNLYYTHTLILLIWVDLKKKTHSALEFQGRRGCETSISCSQTSVSWRVTGRSFIQM